MRFAKTAFNTVISLPMAYVLTAFTFASGEVQPHRSLVSEQGESDPYRSCAVNCFYVVCQLRGRDVTFSSVKELLRPRENGDCSIADIERAAKAVGLDAVSAKVDRRDISKIPFPAIAHLRSRALQSSSNHYVVLMGVFREGVVTIDPPNAATYHPHQEFCDDWSGAVVAFPVGEESRRHFVASLSGEWRPRIAVLFVGGACVLFMLGWGLTRVLKPSVTLGRPRPA
jgi:ABC-type bacteriocin/lantibiotic exporter with double-glycine peptidase domain